MQSDLPFYESPEQALTAAVQQLGGAKVVGSALWPDKSPEAARTRLLDCLNPSRAERLDLSECMFILRRAREKGLHTSFQWLAQEIGYEARPVQQAEEAQRLATVVEQSMRVMNEALGRLERLRASGGG